MRRALPLVPAAAAAALALPPAAFAHGEPVPVDRLASAWSAPPLVLAGAVVAAALFTQGFVRLRRRGRPDHAPWSRAALFAAGLAVGVLALCSPLDAVGESYLVSAHMLQHVLIMDVAPLLVLLAIRGPLCFFVIPQPVLRRAGHWRPLRAFLHLVFRPLVSLAIWATVLLAWHVPASYEATLSDRSVHDLEHATFVLAGFLAWSQLIDPARREVLSRPQKIVFALAMALLAQPIMEALAFSGRVVYSSYARQPERLLGLSAYADQHWAAVVMFVEEIATLGVFAAVLLWPYFRPAPAAEPAEPAGPAVR